MTRLSAAEQGLDPHYKVRVVLPSAILHLASWTEPKILDWDDNRAEADWITDHHYGDTIGHIDWRTVVAITWRWTP